MKKWIIVSLIFGVLFVNKTNAQNFDGDSIYYTAIPKPSKRSVKAVTKSSEPNKSLYFFSLQVGSLVGCNNYNDGKDITSSISVLNGITMGNKFRTAFGLGFDSYIGWHTLPVFLSVSYDLFGNKNRNAFFIQVNYGRAKAWRQKNYRDYAFKKAEGGSMFTPQVGYRIKYHDVRLALMVGVKFQNVRSFHEYPNWVWTDGGYKEVMNMSIVKQEMTRFMISLNVGWK